MVRQNMKQELKTLQQSLLRIIKNVNRLADKMGKRGKAASGNGNGKSTGNGRQSGKILSAVEQVIKRSRRGISIFEIKEKTGFGDRQISNALYKLTKKGAVEAKSRGRYIPRGR